LRGCPQDIDYSNGDEDSLKEWEKPGNCVGDIESVEERTGLGNVGGCDDKLRGETYPGWRGDDEERHLRSSLGGWRLTPVCLARSRSPEVWPGVPALEGDLASR
jgi:hypothetical protein